MEDFLRKSLFFKLFSARRFFRKSLIFKLLTFSARIFDQKVWKSNFFNNSKFFAKQFDLQTFLSKKNYEFFSYPVVQGFLGGFRCFFKKEVSKLFLNRIHNCQLKSNYSFQNARKNCPKIRNVEHAKTEKKTKKKKQSRK